MRRWAHALVGIGLFLVSRGGVAEPKSGSPAPSPPRPITWLIEARRKGSDMTSSVTPVGTQAENAIPGGAPYPWNCFYSPKETLHRDGSAFTSERVSIGCYVNAPHPLGMATFGAQCAVGTEAAYDRQTLALIGGADGNDGVILVVSCHN